ncbi:MAG: class I SAM-dependent methyltransferase [Oscillospiraceae bacterium]|nr:class I SAM-dependent methyltransferase [Oscillospiraceae bacterium]
MSARKSFNAITIINRAVSEQVKQGDICIDATAGRGNDTLTLCSLVGDSGHVTAFDIQQSAIDSTRTLLEENGLLHRAELILQSHADMDSYFEEGTVSCIMFNFGWLPGGEHSIHTSANTSIEALKKALKLIKKGGMITLIIYYGRDTGFEEKDAILQFLPGIDSEKYTVLEMPFVNRPNCPPIPVIIIRDEA